MAAHMMVDLETMGTDHDAAILSIGAVKFTRESFMGEFYREVELQDALDHGLSISASTLEWWLQQDSEVQSVLQGGRQLKPTLQELERFYDGGKVWAKAPSFDCVILDSAYEACGMQLPWEYYNQRDVRTLDDLFSFSVEERGNAHNALDDAKNQARFVQKVLEEGI